MADHLLDRALAALAPGLAARRAAARLALARAELAAARLSLARKITNSYDAAGSGRRTDGWARVGTSQNAEAGSALHRLRNGARELVRNDPFAARAPRVFAAHLVGAGITPRAITEDQAARARLRDRWQEFVETCDPEGRLDWYGLQRLAARTLFESGEALVLWTPRAARGGVAWTVQVLEPDFLDTQKTGRLPSGNIAIQGVEFDATGRRVAYWLFDRHPGDRFGLSLGGLASKRISAEFVDHLFEVLRPGQVRGVPWLAPVALTLRDIKDLNEAELVRKKLEACITAVVFNPDPVEDPTVGKSLTDSEGNAVDELEPGMILHAQPGYELNFHAPEASEGLVEHMKERLHAIAAGAGLTYHQLTGDLSSANYSSLRGGLVEFRQMLDGWQADLMIQPCCRPAWRRVQGEGAPRARYIAPARPWVDPQKDVSARVTAVENYFESPQDVIAERGQDAEEQLDELAAWREALAARGLPVPQGGAPGTSTSNGANNDS